MCQKVNDYCKTWNATNGDCITCYDGYGTSMYNGMAINGTCPLYDSSVPPFDPNCQQLN